MKKKFFAKIASLTLALVLSVGIVAGGAQTVYAEVPSEAYGTTIEAFAEPTLPPIWPPTRP